MTTKLSEILHRKNDCHKGDFGHILIIGGDVGMAGAVIMAAEAAYKTGAGKVSVLTKQDHISALLSRVPNAMYILENDDIFNNKTVIALGMGLGKSSWSRDLFKKAMQTKLPKIIDADALNLLSESLEKFDLTNCIITPHIGEAARLLALSTDKIKNNREAAVKKLYEKYGAIAILKGNNSLIYDGQEIIKCPHGNAGMATAGMGDVLSGIISALLAQKLSAKDAAFYGVNIHALSGDLVAKEHGMIGLTPLDVINFLPRIINFVYDEVVIKL